MVTTPRDERRDMAKGDPLNSDLRYSDLIEKICKLAAPASGHDAAAVKGFMEAYYAAAAAEDLADRTPRTLYAMALSHLKLARKRRAGAALVKVFNPSKAKDGWTSPHTVIQIVNDDMPFLVDSITAALAGLGREVFLLLHPTMFVERSTAGVVKRLTGGDGKRESLIHIEVDQQSDTAALEAIARRLETVLADVRAAVEDWRPMTARLAETVADLKINPPPIDDDDFQEILDFLAWLEDHFTFLGYRHYSFAGKSGQEDMKMLAGTALGILRNPDVHVLRTTRGLGVISAEVRHFLRSPDPLVITKANVRATVHRPVHMDYIGVKIFDAAGRVVGERRFVGLFTSVFYTRSPREIPLLRRKVRRAQEAIGFSATSHDGKALLNVLETFPRDELFQIDQERLNEVAFGIMRLEERPRVKVFIRPDRFERFISVLAFAPRERYSTDLRERIQAVLCEVYEGAVSAHYSWLSDGPLARVHIIIRTRPGKVPKVDLAALDARIIQAAKSWEDRLRDALVEAHGEAEGLRLWTAYGQAFSAGYREEFGPEYAVDDLAAFETLEGGRDYCFHAYRLAEDGEDCLRIRLYHRSRLIPLSDCLPLLEHTGLRVLEEQAYDLQFGDGPGAWILDFLCSDAQGGRFDIAALKDRLQDVLEVTLAGEVEDDGFNMLVTRAGLDWRQADLMRAMARYLRQTTITYSQEYLCATLVNHPAITADIARLFGVLLDPAYRGDREAERRRLAEAVDKALEAVSSLDQDRIVRLFLNLVCSILRTNYYCRDAEGRCLPAISFKIDSKALDELPEPRPMVEIFVYSPRVEGIHLRGGRIARGGLRWSDRREDFRTEVLGLMKAQMVKNAIIVPVGAKGGFVVKRPPAGDREALQAEGIACYKVFVTALLDLTDNIRAGKVVPPRGIVRRDGDDPYMVVAADKGTASFSDIANEISREKDFWLGDAFASGGSVGYDHKKMGITARGAWVNVQRHFREMGVDVQKDSITVIGIGDMSGDVFGNGLMRSRAVRLVAAFDHRDIFIDPDPDPEKSFEERQRLYNLPRSSWQDYDKSLISKGGGVFSRQLKSIRLSPEMRALLRQEADHLTPAALIKALLQTPADLLFVGGIGTFVKASAESHVQVGDRSNDALRIDARDLRVKVVGEGGNLGFTQLGRIEFARKGGRINTDAVDNAAGVNTSDHEVNIKILLNHLLAGGEMTAQARKALLAAMTEDVVASVLEDNYQQSQTLSVLEAQATQLVEYQKRLMRAMERRGRLNRQVEYLPSDEALAELAKEDKALTRPELAVLVAYAKMVLFDDILESDIPRLASMEDMLHRYVPSRLDKAWGEALEKHQLRDEIIATELANEIVNYAGPTFLLRVEEESGFSQQEAIRAYVVSRNIYNLRDLWERIEALDHKVPATIQYLMFLDTIELLRRNTQRLLTGCQGEIDVARLTDLYRADLVTLAADPESLLSEFELQAYREKRDMYIEQGVPGDLARDIAALEPLVAACDIIDVARHRKLSVEATARCYFRLGSLIGLDWLRAAAEDFQVSDYWEALAINAMIDDMLLQHKHLAIAALKSADPAKLAEAAAQWVRRNKAAVERVHQLLADFRTSGPVDVSKLGYATRFIRQLTPRRN